MLTSRCARLVPAFAILCLLGCATLEGDYAKSDLTERPSFAPVHASVKAGSVSYFTGSVNPADLPRAEDLVIARFGPGPETLDSIDLHLAPADFNGNRRYDGFDVTLTPLDAQYRSVKSPGGLILEIYRFNPDTLDSLGEKLLVWKIPESELLAAWDRNCYHFHLTWWQTKPRQENFYVVMVATFVSHEGRTSTQTKAPVLISQSRYE